MPGPYLFPTSLPTPNVYLARHRVRALQTHEGGEHLRLIFNILGCSQLEMRSKYDYEQVDGDSDKFC
ncbi:unnamed protein product [Gadus morhua 'NCC']